MISYDTETRDPNLLTQGPGNIRSAAGHEPGKVVGVSLGVGDRDGEQWYFPIDHTNIDEPDADNMDRDQVTRFLRDVLETDVPKLGANLLYDMGWLKSDLGIYVHGRQNDVQIDEQLINEHARSHALGILCATYGTDGKEEKEMYEWQAEQFGTTASR